MSRWVSIPAILILTGCAFLLLASCVSVSPDFRARQTLSFTCEQYASTLDTLALYRNKLSPPQIQTVDNVIIIAGPICENQSEFNARAVLAQVERQLERAILISNKVKPNGP